jgi:SagB-type dehydrogenase family enzyme
LPVFVSFVCFVVPGAFPEAPVGPAWRLSLSEGVAAPPGLSAGVADALRRLAGPGETAGALAEHVRTTDGPAALPRWFYLLQGLARRRLLRLSAVATGDRLAMLAPTAPSFVLPPAGAEPARPYVLSRFAWARRRGDVLAVEAPLSAARVELHDPRAAAFLHALARPGTAADLAGRVPGLPAEAATPLLGLLAHAGAACPVGPDGSAAEDADAALRCWQFHDVLFHSRSRAGRHDEPVGATFPQAGRLDPPPALLAEEAGEAVELSRPDLERLCRDDPPFALVQERRRSVRRYAAEPITRRQLGELLYRVCRVRAVEEMDVATPAGPVRMGFALRPYPSGGALYELEAYAAVRACGGLAPGLYRYDPLGHRLRRRAGPTAAVGRLLGDAALSAGLTAEGVQVLLVLAARVPRVAWKYAGLAYALVLKNAGALIQTLYLAATAMGLSPCALGSGDSDLFAHAAGVNGHAEAPVGEMLVGGAPRDEGR